MIYALSGQIFRLSICIGRKVISRNSSIFCSIKCHNQFLTSKTIPIVDYGLFCNTKNGNDPIICYTDGACVNNGRIDTVAGIGIYFGDGHEDNVSEGLGVGQHTNNRTEMLAILRALEICIQRNYQTVLIRTDSELIVKTMSEWIHIWKARNWKRAHNNKPVKNSDLIERIDTLCNRIESVSFEHVSGVTNKKAHNLASKGMMKEKMAAL